MKDVFQGGEKYLITSGDMARARRPAGMFSSGSGVSSHCSALQWRRSRELSQAPNRAQSRASINICWRKGNKSIDCFGKAFGRGQPRSHHSGGQKIEQVFASLAEKATFGCSECQSACL